MDRSAKTFECQKVYAARLFDKIDYHKKLRLQIPLFSAVANFAFLSISIQHGSMAAASYLFVLMFVAIGLTSAATLELVRRSFNRNVGQLKYLYARMSILGESFGQDDDELVERARPMWLLLQFLVLVSWAIPCMLVAFTQTVT